MAATCPNVRIIQALLDSDRTDLGSVRGGSTTCGYIADFPPRRQSGRADDRQFRRCPSRASGDAVAAHRGRGRPAPAVGGADVRSASARVLRARRGAAAPDAAAPEARRVSRVRRRDDVRRALRRTPRRAVAAGIHRRRAGRAARRRAGCWSATISVSARDAPATSPCCARMRGRSASKACARSPSSRSARRRRAVRQALAAGDLERATALLGRPYTIAGRVAHGDKLRPRTWAFRPPTFRCASVPR